LRFFSQIDEVGTEEEDEPLPRPSSPGDVKSEGKPDPSAADKRTVGNTDSRAS
jgi:hypothetical protein